MSLFFGVLDRGRNVTIYRLLIISRSYWLQNQGEKKCYLGF
jgi:hypothetical protein